MELENYIYMMNFFSTAVGPDYEIVLFDYRDETPQILSIANGALSGRQKSDGIPDLIEKAIKDKLYLEYDYIFNKRTEAPNKKIFRSSISFIKRKRQA